MRIPAAPLLLGLAGLIPFLYGALTILSPAVYELGLTTFGSRFVAPFVLLQYGVIILCFMSGVLWGFATKAHGETAALLYALSVIPALYAFFFVGAGPTRSAVFLIAGFVGLLGLDWTFWKHGLAPEWWMRLRLLLTVVVSACLAVVIFA